MATRLDSGLSDYLKDIKRYDLLTAEEERELARDIRAVEGLDQRFARGEIGLSEREDIEQRAAEARDRMIQANLRLVVSVAKHFRNRGLPMEDLINEGNVGLVNAVDRFDPDVGSRFSTYASYWIDQAIRRALQNAGQIIHIPAYLMEHIGHIKLAQRELEERLGRPPTLNEVAEHLDMTPRKAKVLSDAIRSCMSPMQQVNDDTGAMGDALADTRTPAPFEGMFTESDNDFVSRLLSKITEREATVLRLRYGLKSGARRMTLKEIGEKIGLTRERVRQIEQEARKKLMDLMKSTG